MTRRIFLCCVENNKDSPSSPILQLHYLFLGIHLLLTVTNFVKTKVQMLEGYYSLQLDDVISYK